MKTQTELVKKLLAGNCFENIEFKEIKEISLSEDELYFDFELPSEREATNTRWAEDEYDYEPLIVRKENGRYVVLDGYHRFVYLRGKVEKFKVLLIR